ncbi:RNA polymerase sigma factor [Dyadobacter arcticus]|uniref:RNA polymerase sigma-70 factor (ECF subfamily) n=1 Tax=Dyadobacter arcticus TaxID=1078754 RepID=A0ABX0ULK5_9BACT|nr:sigma-70 family RNA polymerase sigma factor [Dyadobacter arcticus]NIJ53782.1 RNA polymerase sigma-70 factor (ECF subfamily) [Dyadobacter arcticus]
MTLFSKTFSDSELIEGIRGTHAQRRVFENKLYEKYSYMIREAVWKHKLSEDECSMVYSDTILTVLEHIHNGRFKGNSSIKTYLYQIFTNKCVDVLRKNATNKQQVILGDSLDAYLCILPDDSKGIIETLIAQYDMDLLTTRLKELGEKCRQIVQAWGEGFMDQEIAIEMGYQSAAVVKTSRLRCLEKLRGLYGREGKEG